MNDEILTEKLRGVELKFRTRPGVFSSKGLDSGTRLLIEEMEVNESDGALIADLGTGSGVLGITIAKLNPKSHVHLLDDHLRAINLAEVNVELNRARNVEVYLSDMFSAVENRTYHKIFTNPPAQLGNEFLEEFVDQCYEHLKPNGEVWLVVVNHLKNVVTRYLEKNFKSIKLIAHGKEHVVVRGIK